MKKLVIVLFLVTASMVYAPRVFAEMEVYYESYETGGVIETGYNTTPLLFTFQVPEPRLFGNGGNIWIGANLKQRNASCTGSWRFHVASTTEPTINFLSGGSLWYTDTFPITYREYNFYTATRPSTSKVPSVWLYPDRDYGVYADITCNGKNLSVTADELGLTAYGFISWGGNYIDDFNAGGAPTVPPEPVVPDPVIIVPGIMGSAYKNGELVIDPILHTYDDLIATLDENGYTPGVDLFTFPYEWRDSNVFSANLLDDKISEVKAVCNCGKVDLVAHSMGGLVARSYIQSTDYDADVDQLIFLGTPHKGAPTDYLTWEAGKNDTDVKSQIASIFFQAEALRNGYSTIFNYIHNRPILSVQELLPTFDYLKDKSTGILRTYPSNYPRNFFLESLNNNVSNLLNSGVRITNIIGNSGENKTINIIRVIPTDHQIFWQDGEPEGFGAIIGDNGLERGVGDNTVAQSGSVLNGVTGEEIMASHNRIPTVAESEVFGILTGKTASTTFDHNYGVDKKVLLLQLLSPVDVVITAPDGKKIGKNFSNGTEYNEIPGAFYSGYQTNDEYITILDPIDGKYKIETQGTGNGGEYAVLTSSMSDAVSTTVQFSATTTPGQIIALDLSLDINNPSDLNIVPEDQTPPAISITSPIAKDYLRSEMINISATTTDSSGISSFKLSINGNNPKDGDKYDPFFGKLGIATLFAASTDNVGNIATSGVSFRVIATIDSAVSDINRAYNLGWIFDKKTRDDLVRKVHALRNDKTIDKKAARALATNLNDYLKGKINERAYNIIKEDIEWLVNN